MKVYHAELLNRRRLSDTAFEIELTKPPSFEFIPGQRIRMIHHSIERDYSLVTSPSERTLKLCVKYVEGGKFSPLIATVEDGTDFDFTGPHGYFVFIPSCRPAVFIATGTGIAPFASMARTGVKGFTLLHGVRSSRELYYETLFRSVSARYVACVTQISEGGDIFRGRVTDYLSAMMPRQPHDFYLCGRGDMIRDVILLVDEQFPGSFVYTESFY